MNSRKILIMVFSGLAILISGCNRTALVKTPLPDSDQLNTIVAGTMAVIEQPTTTAAPPENVSQEPAPATEIPEDTNTPLPTETPTQTLTPSPAATSTLAGARVYGKVCYPSEVIPAQTAYFQDTETDQVVELPIAENQTSYEINLPPGTYVAYTWLPDFSWGGLYSHAVPCGLTAECDDHSALPFDLDSGDIVQNIDLCDWYHGPFDIPYPPDYNTGEVTGSITGALSYPSESIPPLRVVAYNTSTGYWYWVGTAANQSGYLIEDLPPGTYNVVAYTEHGLAGGYSDYAACGLVSGCGGHGLVNVPVEAGKTASGIDPGDWYAPEGSFPPDLTR